MSDPFWRIIQHRPKVDFVDERQNLSIQDITQGIKSECEHAKQPRSAPPSLADLKRRGVVGVRLNCSANSCGQTAEFAAGDRRISKARESPPDQNLSSRT